MSNGKLRNGYHKYNHPVFAVFLVALAVSLGFLGFGVYNIIFMKPESTTNFENLAFSLASTQSANPFVMPVSESQEFQFNLSLIYMNWILPLTVNVSLTSDVALVENDLSEINITLTWSNMTEQAQEFYVNDFSINVIGVESTFPDAYSASGYNSNYYYNRPLYAYPYEIPSVSSDNITWTSSSYCVLQSINPIVLEIQAYTSPSYVIENQVNNYLRQTSQSLPNSYENNLTLSIPIVTQAQLTNDKINLLNQHMTQRTTALQAGLSGLALDISAQQSINQQHEDTLNLALTSFIIFFACLDIALFVYDHSESEYYKADQYYEGATEYYTDEKYYFRPYPYVDEEEENR